MKYIKTFEQKNNESILLIVDVQKSFSKYFTLMYINQLNKYCNEFSDVYQIFDNHVDGKNVSKDYLYKENPEIPVHDDLYNFPNQKDIIEKRYNYDVNVYFYKKILNKEVYNEIKHKEDNNLLKRGDYFYTKEGTIIVYIGNNHIWYHCPKKLYNLFKQLDGKEITMVGGSDSECYLDVETTAKSLGVNVKRNYKYIYSANHCPL